MASKGWIIKSYPCYSPFPRGITERGCDRKLLSSSPVGKLGDKGWIYNRRLTKNSREDFLVTCPICPHKIPVIFLVDTGAQVSILKIEDASSCEITPSCKGIFVVDNFGNTQPQTTAKVRC